ncbi:MAG: recombinase RecA [Dethiosulfovibrio peptidovorans]|nr:MAG: recombinase RecA [Dethiosulfovibrio peptidovorans]
MAVKKKVMTREDVLEAAIDDIRGKFGDGSIMRLGDGTMTNVEVIPTGILPLDVALGIGGFPRGRIVEVFGPEGSGKTTLALHAVAEAQKAGGVAAFIDAEHALDPRLAQALGVNVADLYISQPDSGEQALYILETLVRSGAVDIVVVDSVAALTPQAEIDGKIGESQVGLQARLMSYSLRRLTSAIAKSNSIVVFINQLRATIPTGYSRGPSETTTGGRALKFYTSVRVEVRRGRSVNKGDQAIGHELFIKVVKNKQAPPFRSAHATLVYGKGIPRLMSTLDMALDTGVIKRKGSWLAYKGETLGQGKDKVAAYLEEHPELENEIVKTVLDEVAKGLGFIAATDDEPSENGEGPSVIDVEEEVMDLAVDDDLGPETASDDSK